MVMLLQPQAQAQVQSQVIEMDSSSLVTGIKVAAQGLTYLVWRSMPDQGIPTLLRDAVRVLPGAHRVR